MLISTVLLRPGGPIHIESSEAMGGLGIERAYRTYCGKRIPPALPDSIADRRRLCLTCAEILSRKLVDKSRGSV